MNTLTLKNLKSIARQVGVRGFSRYTKHNKQELSQLITDYREGRAGFHKRTRKEIKTIAKESKISGYSKLNKQDLLDAVAYYSKHVKPELIQQRDSLKAMSVKELRVLGRKENVMGLGGKKDKILQCSS